MLSTCNIHILIACTITMQHVYCGVLATSWRLRCDFKLKVLWISYINWTIYILLYLFLINHFQKTFHLLISQLSSF